MTTTFLHYDKKEFLKQNRIYYLTGIAIFLTMKLLFRNADANALRWMLAPTSRLVSFLSGVPFLWESHLGYVSHDLRFVIAASCSGINFMLITLMMLIFSFSNRFKSFRFVGISIVISYVYTVSVNSLRILIAIYLPAFFDRYGLWTNRITPDKLHTIIGIVVFFSALLLLYSLVDKQSGRFTLSPEHRPHFGNFPAYHTLWVPLFWYLAVVLGIPFLNKISNIFLRNFLNLFLVD